MKTVVLNLNELSDADNIGSLKGEISDFLVDNYLCIVSGESFKYLDLLLGFKSDFNNDLLNNLYLAPFSGSSLYQYWSSYGWIPTYQFKVKEQYSAVEGEFLKTLSDSLFKVSSKCDSCIGISRDLSKKFFDIASCTTRNFRSRLEEEFKGLSFVCSGINSINVLNKDFNESYLFNSLSKETKTSLLNFTYLLSSELLNLFPAKGTGSPGAPGVSYEGIVSVRELSKFLSK